MPFDTAAHQWSDGLSRLAQAPADERDALERVTSAIQARLRQRLGGPYTSEELVALYEEGTTWCSEVALEVAPDEPYAWDARTVVDAAFGRYLQGATDYAGGKRIT
ncbi:MAG: hypothetical protein M3P40_08890 [Actinomycetota bacterium]|nr:hypothetical protein [Actinomycetota bacterium]